MEASSTGWPARPRGTLSPNAATLSAGMFDGIRGVHIGPGATLLTRIPFSPNGWARLAEKFAMAAFVAA